MTATTGMNATDPAGREAALELDRTDPLASWRDDFVIPDPAVVYLDGN